MTLEPPAPPEPVPPRKRDELTTRWLRLRDLDGNMREDTWRWFVERYRPFVHDVLALKLGSSRNAATAEEEFWGYLFLSDAVRRACVQRSFRAYLAGIARNFARDWLRKQHARGATSVDPDLLPDDSESESVVSKSFVANVLALAIGTLRLENAHAALCLVDFYGVCTDAKPKPASAIAKETQRSVDAVYMTLHRGRQRLRELVVAEITEGCADEEAANDELRLLLGVTATRHPGLLSPESGAA